MNNHQSTSFVRPLSRRLLDLIRSLSINQPYCYAGDEFLARKLGTSPEQVSDLLFGLEEDGLISIQYPPLQKRRIYPRKDVGMPFANREESLRERKKENIIITNSETPRRLSDVSVETKVYVVVVSSDSKSAEEIAAKIQAAIGDAEVSVIREDQEPVQEPRIKPSPLETDVETSPANRLVLEDSEPSVADKVFEPTVANPIFLDGDDRPDLEVIPPRSGKKFSAMMKETGRPIPDGLMGIILGDAKDRPDPVGPVQPRSQPVQDGDDDDPWADCPF